MCTSQTVCRVPNSTVVGGYGYSIRSSLSKGRGGENSKTTLESIVQLRPGSRTR